MPTIQVMSDLHLEFHADRGREFVKSLDPTGVDVLVLAGDIGVENPRSDGHLGSVLGTLCQRYPEVVFVVGNHEFYGSNQEWTNQQLAFYASTFRNLTWLDCKVAVVAGIRFVGGTLWFPKPDPKTLTVGKWQLNDYAKIGGFEPWVYEEHQRCEALLRAAASTADVVVTHHIPTRHGITPEYRGSPLNHFFCCDLTELIEEASPPLWVFGHTHSPMSFTWGSTRLVCNAFGYPREPKAAFRDRLLIDVEPRS